MKFTDTLNEYIVLIVVIMVMALIIGLRLGYRNGGWKRNMVYLWTLIVYSIYVLISPLYFYLSGNNIVIGTDISEYYGLGFAFNTLAILSFVVGYWIRGPVENKVWLQPQIYVTKDPKKIITILFYSLYVIVLANLAAGGANIQQVFIGDEVLGLGGSGGSYFLQNFTDSLICVIVLAYLYGIPGRTLLLWVGLSFFLFSLLGFRYRIVLSLFGILFVYLYKNQVNAKRLAIGAGMALLFFYGIMFSTENRKALILRTYDEVKIDPLEFKYERFFEQTRGALPDMAVYRLFDNPNRDANYDYGLTMFGYVFIRMIPRAIYADKDRFYPPPQLATTIQAYDAWWAKFSGEATLSVAALYIAFGWIGVVLGHFIWAILIRRFADSRRISEKIHIATYIVIALVSFQWITRGYFPQVIDHFAYMMVPIWTLRYFSEKQKLLADN